MTLVSRLNLETFCVRMMPTPTAMCNLTTHEAYQLQNCVLNQIVTNNLTRSRGQLQKLVLPNFPNWLHVNMINEKLVNGMMEDLRMRHDFVHNP